MQHRTAHIGSHVGKERSLTRISSFIGTVNMGHKETTLR